MIAGQAACSDPGPHARHYVGITISRGVHDGFWCEGVTPGADRMTNPGTAMVVTVSLSEAEARELSLAATLGHSAMRKAQRSDTLAGARAKLDEALARQRRAGD